MEKAVIKITVKDLGVVQLRTVYTLGDSKKISALLTQRLSNKGLTIKIILLFVVSPKLTAKRLNEIPEESLIKLGTRLLESNHPDFPKDCLVDTGQFFADFTQTIKNYQTKINKQLLQSMESLTKSSMRFHQSLVEGFRLPDYSSLFSSALQPHWMPSLRSAELITKKLAGMSQLPRQSILENLKPLVGIRQSILENLKPLDSGRLWSQIVQQHSKAMEAWGINFEQTASRVSEAMQALDTSFTQTAFRVNKGFAKLWEGLALTSDVESMLKEHQWTLPKAVPREIVKELTNLIDQPKKIQKQRIEKLLLDYYQSDDWAKARELAMTWEGNPLFKKVLPSIKTCSEVLRSIEKKDDINPVRVVLPVLVICIESLSREYLLLNYNKKGLKLEEVKKELEIAPICMYGYTFGSAAERLLIEDIFQSAKPGEPLKIKKSLSRHKLMHGERDYLNRYNDVDILRALFVIDFVAGWRVDDSPKLQEHLETITKDSK